MGVHAHRCGIDDHGRILMTAEIAIVVFTTAGDNHNMGIPLTQNGANRPGGTASAQNQHFFTFHTHQRPFITLKWARTADGFIDAVRNDASQKPLLISTPETQVRSHRLRTTHQAILVGHRTLLLDRPSLTPRAWDGPQPLRCVLGTVPADELPEGFEAFPTIDSLLAELYRRNIQALLVEGGTRVLQSFIDRNLWDEAWEEIGTEVLQQPGVPAPTISTAVIATEDFGGHSFVHYTNPSNS
jgi:diaminohydroxyphosphoribosylaminopyrimidine deaminase/5-amino-6-(5-phosphoribosylamino)uracil reductase